MSAASDAPYAAIWIVRGQPGRAIALRPIRARTGVAAGGRRQRCIGVAPFPERFS
jgi:hypothetical protein